MDFLGEVGRRWIYFGWQWVVVGGDIVYSMKMCLGFSLEV